MTTSEQMIQIAKGSQLAVCQVAAACHPQDVDKANGFASELGGWDIVAVRFPDLVVCAQEHSDINAATYVGITALCRVHGYAMHI